MLTHTYPHKPLSKIKVIICNHQADSQLSSYVWPDIWLVIFKFRKVWSYITPNVLTDTRCHYRTQTQLTFIQIELISCRLTVIECKSVSWLSVCLSQMSHFLCPYPSQPVTFYLNSNVCLHFIMLAYSRYPCFLDFVLFRWCHISLVKVINCSLPGSLLYWHVFKESWDRRYIGLLYMAGGMQVVYIIHLVYAAQ